MDEYLLRTVIYCLTMIHQKHYVLNVIAHRSEGGFLQAPKIGGKMITISETLNSTLEIKLSFLSNVGEQVIFEDTGRFAGFEIGGDIAHLKKMYNTIVYNEKNRY